MPCGLCHKKRRVSKERRKAGTKEKRSPYGLNYSSGLPSSWGASVRNQQVLAMLPSVTEVRIAKCAQSCTQIGGPN